MRILCFDLTPKDRDRCHEAEPEVAEIVIRLGVRIAAGCAECAQVEIRTLLLGHPIRRRGDVPSKRQEAALRELDDAIDDLEQPGLLERVSEVDRLHHMEILGNDFGVRHRHGRIIEQG